MVLPLSNDTSSKKMGEANYYTLILLSKRLRLSLNRILCRFITDLQKEVLRAEFYRLSAGKDTISPLQLAQSILRYSKLSKTQRDQGLKKVAESITLEKDDIDFDSYCAFFNLLFQYEDLQSALKMFLYSNRSISRGKQGSM